MANNGLQNPHQQVESSRAVNCEELRKYVEREHKFSIADSVAPKHWKGAGVAKRQFDKWTEVYKSELAAACRGQDTSSTCKKPFLWKADSLKKIWQQRGWLWRPTSMPEKNGTYQRKTTSRGTTVRVAKRQVASAATNPPRVLLSTAHSPVTPTTGAAVVVTQEEDTATIVVQEEDDSWLLDSPFECARPDPENDGGAALTTAEPPTPAVDEDKEERSPLADNRGVKRQRVAHNTATTNAAPATVADSLPTDQQQRGAADADLETDDDNGVVIADHLQQLMVEMDNIPPVLSQQPVLTVARCCWCKQHFIATWDKVNCSVCSDSYHLWCLHRPLPAPRSDEQYQTLSKDWTCSSCRFPTFEKKLKCPRGCRKRLDDEAKFCQECGSTLLLSRSDSADTQALWSACSANLPPDDPSNLIAQSVAPWMLFFVRQVANHRNAHGSRPISVLFDVQNDQAIQPLIDLSLLTALALPSMTPCAIRNYWVSDCNSLCKAREGLTEKLAALPAEGTVKHQNQMEDLFVPLDLQMYAQGVYEKWYPLPDHGFDAVLLDLRHCATEQEVAAIFNCLPVSSGCLYGICMPVSDTQCRLREYMVHNCVVRFDWTSSYKVVWIQTSATNDNCFWIFQTDSSKQKH